MREERLEGKNVKPGDGCLNFEEELPAYLEGENRPVILEHAEVCEFCRCVLTDLELVRSASWESGLDEPSPVVWASVRAALVAEGIIHPRLSFWQRWLPFKSRGLLRSPVPVMATAAAAVAAVVLLRFPYVSNLSRTHSAAAMRPAVLAENYDVSSPSASQTQQTIQQLEQAYYANEASMEPSLKATYEKSLQSLDDEIRECQASMQQQPQNTLAGEYLSSAYMQKAQLLQSALEYNLR